MIEGLECLLSGYILKIHCLLVPTYYLLKNESSKPQSVESKLLLGAEIAIGC